MMIKSFPLQIIHFLIQDKPISRTKNKINILDKMMIKEKLKLINTIFTNNLQTINQPQRLQIIKEEINNYNLNIKLLDRKIHLKTK